MGKQYTYVYVEDDALSREIMETLLISLIGVKNLLMLPDSANLISRLDTLETPPHFILLDIHVKPHNGYELLKMLRQHPTYQSCKVLAVTASVMSNEVNQLKAGGFDGAIGKPLDMATFPDLIRRLEAGESVWQVT
jgi:CheY-like chemotaxis protein